MRADHDHISLTDALAMTRTNTGRTLLELSRTDAGHRGLLIVFLRHDSLRRAVYDRGSKSFIIGICLTAAGVISAVVIDFVQILV